MLFLFIYVFIYCNIDNILNKLYFSNYELLVNNELIINNTNIYYSITNINTFIIPIYFIFILNKLIFNNEINNKSLSLALIYFKYNLNLLLDTNMKWYKYEISRNIMWLFTTPLMLNIYCDINNIKLIDINMHYHIMSLIINIFIHPYKNTFIYYYFNIISYILFFFFMKTLYKNKHASLTNIYLIIWGLFASINIIEMFGIVDIYTINLYYLYADMISKLTVNFIINDYDEIKIYNMNNIDLQSINFISVLIENINQYRINNPCITPQCNNLINNTLSNFISKIPKNKDFLKKELLKKILPFGFDEKYILSEISFENANTKAISFNMICILFIDIVNYTELAKKYNDEIIFSMLNNVYIAFDNIIKKYSHLQKVETIGDAYMVVGDIYRNTNNHKIVVKEMMLLSVDLINETKKIKTPDLKQLSIRIGINMGKVSIGVLGNKIPRLCVVGNAVNVAARLQSTADIDSIQMSMHIYEQVMDLDINFEIITKENVFLKNIGSVSTYNIYPIKNV